MGSYYYACASLPFLELETDHFIYIEDFFFLCSQISKHDLKIIESARLTPNFKTDVHSLITVFWRWELGLRNELIRQRSQILHREPRFYYDNNGSDCMAIGNLSASVKEIIQMTSPLKADEEIDRLRWYYLDELETGHYFNLEYMIIYYLRLQILSRRSLLSIDKGQESYQRHHTNIYQQISQDGVYI